jgi:hypothetical protein
MIDEKEKTIVFLDVGLRKSIYDWHEKTKNLNAVVNLFRPTKTNVVLEKVRLVSAERLHWLVSSFIL